MEDIKEIKQLEATRFEVEQHLNNMISSIKLNGLSKEVKIALFNLKLSISKVMEDLNKFREEAIKNLDKPEKFDELRDKIKNEAATEEEKEEFQKMAKELDAEFSQIAVPYYNTVIKLDFDRIDGDTFKEQFMSNDSDLKLFEYEYLYNKLTK